MTSKRLKVIGLAVSAGLIIPMMFGHIVTTGLALAVVIVLGIFMLLEKWQWLKDRAYKNPFITDVTVSFGAAALCGITTVTGLMAGAFAGLITSVYLLLQ